MIHGFCRINPTIMFRVTSVNYGSYADLLLFFKTMVVPYVSCILYIYSVFYQHSSSLFLALTCVTPFTFAVSYFILSTYNSKVSFCTYTLRKTNNLLKIRWEILVNITKIQNRVKSFFHFKISKIREVMYNRMTNTNKKFTLRPTFLRFKF